MTLPWVRLDSNIATHDKILPLLEEKPAALAYQAAWSYVCGIAYAGGHETDGLIGFNVLPFIHGTKKTALLLVKHTLWRPEPTGWSMPNWASRQPMAEVTERVRALQAEGARRGNCVRWHGVACGCWTGTDSVKRERLESVQ